MTEQVQDAPRRTRKRWLVAAGPVVGVMAFAFPAWACVGGTQNNNTTITSPIPNKGPVGTAIEAKSGGGQLTPGQEFNLVMANTTTGECHHGPDISGVKAANAKGNIGKTNGTIPQRSKGTYEVCFKSTDEMINTEPDFFTVTAS